MGKNIVKVILCHFLSRELRALKPDLPVVLLTGFGAKIGFKGS